MAHAALRHLRQRRALRARPVAAGRSMLASARGMIVKKAKRYVGRKVCICKMNMHAQSFCAALRAEAELRTIKMRVRSSGGYGKYAEIHPTHLSTASASTAAEAPMLICDAAPSAALSPACAETWHTAMASHKHTRRVDRQCDGHAERPSSAED